MGLAGSYSHSTARRSGASEGETPPPCKYLYNFRAFLHLLFAYLLFTRFWKMGNEKNLLNDDDGDEGVTSGKNIFLAFRNATQRNATPL